MTTATDPDVRILSSARRGEFVAFVGGVRVRFRRSDTSDQWACDLCGAHRFATCGHETAARDAWRANTPRRTA